MGLQKILFVICMSLAPTADNQEKVSGKNLLLLFVTGQMRCLRIEPRRMFPQRQQESPPRLPLQFV